MIIAGERYEREKISLKQAAELAELFKRALVEIMDFQYSVNLNKIYYLIYLMPEDIL